MKIRFQIRYQTQWGESLSVVLCDRKYPMQWGEGGLWSVTVPSCPASALRAYGYVVMRDGRIERTEWSCHRRSRIPDSRVCDDSWIDCPIPDCPFPREHQAPMFDQPHWRGAGTAVPVFSLRTADDFGIGDFRDLRPLVDWAAATGQTVIQLLPVNDTTRRGTWEDSYPYSPVSSFALHPLYLRLQEVGVKETAAFRREQKELNALGEIDWPRVAEAKMRHLYAAFRRRGAADLASTAARRFMKENAFWLDDYAAFCARRDGLCEDFYRWTQFHLDRQFSEEVAYARGRGICFKGDLPIGVSADSVEAWTHPELFNLDCAAGAPPDFFSADGQNWGFPTYNWEEMEKDDYAWWKSRLRVMSRYFDAFRIDHILGWFRIWEIHVPHRSGLWGHFNPALPYSADELRSRGFDLTPSDAPGLFLEDSRRPGWYHPCIGGKSSEAYRALSWEMRQGYDALYDDFFYHRHDDFWRINAEKKLPELLGATGMLACGEDLGMVPHCLPGVMDRQKILSLKMRGMQHEGPWKELSVCATSSHDMETLRMQCSEDPSPEAVVPMLEEFLLSPSMLAIFPIQDWLALSGEMRRPDRDERINQPADPHHHWRWRLHLDLHALLPADSPGTHLGADTARPFAPGPAANSLAATIRSLLSSSGRLHA